MGSEHDIPTDQTCTAVLSQYETFAVRLEDGLAVFSASDGSQTDVPLAVLQGSVQL